jgi:hypothetical protein
VGVAELDEAGATGCEGGAGCATAMSTANANDASIPATTGRFMQPAYSTSRDLYTST